jgi:hypothetical protein
LSQPPAQLASIHSGHDNIGDHEVDPLRPGLHQFQGLPAVRRFQRAVALTAENAAHEVAHVGLVVDNEHHATRTFVLGSSRCRRRCSFHHNSPG